MAYLRFKKIPYCDGGGFIYFTLKIEFWVKISKNICIYVYKW